MELRQYLTVIWRWIWLVVLSVIIAASSSYIASRKVTPIYQTKTTMMVGQVTKNPDPNSGELYTGQQLAYTYIQLARREPVLQGALDSIGLHMGWEALANQVNASIVPQTQLLEISVIDSDPYRAKVLADAIAAQLILQSPSAPNGIDQEQITFTQSQIADLKTKIETAQSEMKSLQQELDAANSARQIQDLQTQIDILETKVSNWQGTYSQLLTSLQGGDVNALSVVEQASIPSQPISPNIRMNVLLASTIGLVLAIGGAFFIEYLDDTIKTSDEITRHLDLPVIGYISEMEKGKNKGIYVANNPRSEITEAFRSLRTNLEFAGVDNPLKTILVASPNMSAGKTSIAVNLAIVIAQAGNNVILLETDLRRPSINTFLGLPDSKGLSDALRDGLLIEDAIHVWGEGNIKVISAGELPPNPSELLGGQKMNQILDQLKSMADVVIIDGPPSLVADAAILAAKVDGVLLVIRYGYTRKREALATLEQFRRAYARVLGVALNRMPRSRSDYNNYYRYYNPNSKDLSKEETNHNIWRWKGAIE